ncbi:MAG TPA: COR domain-containing protein [Pyrinomonadaceae bacterium]|nr:COR domain-containing protein [Pyrinomonadaceae bacterium]
MERDEAYQKAEEKIQEALRTEATELDLSGGWQKESPKLSVVPESLGLLTRLHSLDLSNNHLTALPEWLGQLTELQSLNLSSSQLTALPESLGQLTELQSLELSYNQLTELPKWLGQLTELQSLNLSHNQLMALPEWLGLPAQLKSLDLSRNKLTELPESLGQLTKLQSLDLSDNQLMALPESLGQLTELRNLYLMGNQLPTLPESLGQLAELQSLLLDRNPTTTLPGALGQLAQLRQLSCTKNRLRVLPEALGQLSHLESLWLEENGLTALPDSLAGLVANGVLKELYLHGNPALGLPDDMLGPTYSSEGSKPPKEILDYYFSTRGEAGQALRELRLIVVGRPKVGKTSLIKRLRGLAMDPHETETHGIDILPLELECSDGPLHARVWDFGGQHVLHAMHEFFLRSRCLYLLVVEQRANDVERELTYWLQLIRSYAGGAPVVVALNQSKGIPRGLARAALDREYGPILAWVATECESEEKVPGANATIERLRQALTDAAAAMPEPKKLFPRKWLEIKQWLERMEEPYLDYAAYARHCVELHEDDPQQQAALAAAMDELGVALNYARDPRLRDTTVLRPNWLANGIYALLRANILASKPLAPDGVLTEERVGEMLALADQSKVLRAAEYPREKWPFLLRLMNLFQLSFPLDDAGQRYLVPTLLPADEPADSGEPGGPDVVKLRYEFDVVPGPLIGRLLVRLFALIDGRKAWQRGARLRYGHAQARVWADLGETYVYATVAGDGRDAAELLEMIRETLKEMFREYERLRVVEQWWHGSDWVPRGTLEKFGVLIPEADSDYGLPRGKEVRHES